MITMEQCNGANSMSRVLLQSIYVEILLLNDMSVKRDSWN